MEQRPWNGAETGTEPCCATIVISIRVGVLQLRLQDAVRGAMPKSSVHVHGKIRNIFGKRADVKFFKGFQIPDIWTKMGGIMNWQ